LKNVKNYIFWILPSSPLFFYNYFSFLFDPYLSTWQGQNRILSPPVIDYLLAYGLGVLFLILVYKKGLSHMINNRLFLNSWIILIPVLVYFPINIQRRLTEGVWLCFCVYIAVFIMSTKRLSSKMLLLSVFFLSTLLFTIGSVQTVQHVDAPIYSYKTIIEVGKYLHNEAMMGDVVLAPFDESNLLPVYAPIKVITGHGPESKNLDVITEKLNLFYQGQLSQKQTQEFLDLFKIKFIIVPTDFSKTKIIREFSDGQINQVFENNDYVVLKINEK
jgi:hypothetical protein